MKGQGRSWPPTGPRRGRGGLHYWHIRKYKALVLHSTAESRSSITIIVDKKNRNCLAFFGETDGGFIYVSVVVPLHKDDIDCDMVW